MSDAVPPVRRRMVSWLSPSVLARSAAEVALSGLFANYADKRETEGGLSAEPFPYTDEAGPFWLDYASDVGDGFNSTYLIARLMAEPSLTVDGEEMDRGRVLVLGGDEVYPSASWQAYDERFNQPYAAALPAFPEGVQRPDLFAVPGNHDWYDGLTNFMRVFCQGAGIGAWQTQQKRSYFALQLPHQWWLWGIDTQFDAYIDGPQLEYFAKFAESATEGHRIILATAKPSWVHVTDDEPPPQSWQSLAYFHERVICKHGATLALTITGDIHHYARYQPNESDLDPKITAGGGGAYLSPTHWLPDSLHLPSLEGDVTTRYDLKVCWPAKDASRKMRRGILEHLSPLRTFSLNWLLASIYAAIALLLVVGVKDQDKSLQASLTEHSGIGLLGDSLTVWVLLGAALILRAVWAWAVYGDAPALAGIAHGLVQLTAIAGLTLFVLELNPLDAADDGFWLGYLTAAIMAVVGALPGRWILTLYLFCVHHLNERWHANEVFAAQSRQKGTNFKHFVRLRIDAQGLTAFVIGVRDVPRRWSNGARPEPDGPEGTEFVERVQIELVDRIEITATPASLA